MDIIFKIGFFIIPFENFFFAPSAGWATLSPILFFVYLLFNIKAALKSIVRYKEIFIFIVASLILSIINYLFVGVNISNFINAYISLGLGCVTLISFDIYFLQKKNKINEAVKMLIIAYLISFIVGWIQFFSIKLDIEPLKNFFVFLDKRDYMIYNRVSFLFTEPSFIGMHMFGVLLPLYIVTKNKKIIALIIAICLSALFFEASVRLIVDILAIITILGVGYIIKNRKSKKVIATSSIVVVLLVIGTIGLYRTNGRIRQILNKGVYADGSLASRFIRIDSSLKGLKKDIPHTLFGYGMGNAILPIREGYNEAIKGYREVNGDYILKEIETLPQTESDSVCYCMYTRIVSELGLIMTLIAIGYIVRLAIKSKSYTMIMYLFIMLYLYVQFDSYAFYTVWIYIILLKAYNKKLTEK